MYYYVFPRVFFFSVSILKYFSFIWFNSIDIVAQYFLKAIFHWCFLFIFSSQSFLQYFYLLYHFSFYFFILIFCPVFNILYIFPRPFIYGIMFTSYSCLFLFLYLFNCCFFFSFFLHFTFPFSFRFLAF